MSLRVLKLPISSSVNDALHSGTENATARGPFNTLFKASRMRVFALFFTGMFFYFFLPNYMFTALSSFNWLSWIASSNPVYNNIVGFNNGLGLNPWPTFDWNIVSPVRTLSLAIYVYSRYLRWTRNIGYLHGRPLGSPGIQYYQLLYRDVPDNVHDPWNLLHQYIQVSG